MVQLNGLEGVNGNVGQAIPLYQKGFNWIKYWLGFLFGCCLCLILAAAVTFIVLYILTQAGAITATRQGRMMPVNEPIVNGKRMDNHVISEQKLTTIFNNYIDYQITNGPIRTFRSKYDRLKSRRNA